jgi:hypothetical protein
MAKTSSKASLDKNLGKAASPSAAAFRWPQVWDPVPDWLFHHDVFGPEYVTLETEFRIKEAELQIQKMKQIQDLAKRAKAR